MSTEPTTPSGLTGAGEVSCSVCGRPFTPRLAFHTEAQGEQARYFCSLPCRATPDGAPSCSVCGEPVVVRYAFQVIERRGERQYACSEACHDALVVDRAERAARPAPAPPRRQHRAAVLNQKGGTGKTTTAVSLAAGLAEAGRRVLLIDADPQGNVAVSLGLRPQKTLYHVLVEETPLEEAVVPIAASLDVLGADETLVRAEWLLAQSPGRGGLFHERLGGAAGYDHVVIDCGPALSLVNQHALCFSSEVVIPVACEYLSLVGVKQLLATVKRINRQFGHPLEVGGVLPTFYDGRVKACHEALEALQQHFGDRCLPPIRANVRLKEAPRHKKTIFEYDPASHGAEDYRAVVSWMLGRTATDAPVPEGKARPAPVVFSDDLVD